MVVLQAAHPDHRPAIGDHHRSFAECLGYAGIPTRFENAVNAYGADISLPAAANEFSYASKRAFQIDWSNRYAQHMGESGRISGNGLDV